MINDDKKINVLIPDGESHLLLEVVNCLSKVKKARIYVMSNKLENPMKYSRHVHYHVYYPKMDHVTDWITHIDNEVEKHAIDVVMPIFEVAIRDLIEYENYLKYPEKLLAWPTLDNFEKAIDKCKLAKHLNQEKIPCPKTFLVEPLVDVKKNQFPLVVKPTKGFGGGMEVQLIHNHQEWNNFLSKKQKSTTNYIAQEFIEGDDYCCNVLCYKGKIVSYTMQKGILWGPNRFSAQIGYEFIYQEDILNITSRLMESLSWSGVACIDIRYDRDKENYKVIEVNTRYWRSLMGSLAAGVNFPVLSIYQHLGYDVNKTDYNKVTYLNLKGLVKYIRTDFKRVFKFSYIWNNTSFKYAVLDPIPMVYKFFTRKWKLF